MKQLFNKFMNSRFMKAREKAAKAAVIRHMSNRTYNELSRLSDHELRDIGISRGQIYEIAYLR